jgi:hypothetical protein
MPWIQHASLEVNAVSQYPSIIGVCVSLTAVMAACVGLRAYIRLSIVKHLGVDDYVTFVAAVSPRIDAPDSGT